MALEQVRAHRSAVLGAYLLDKVGCMLSAGFLQRMGSLTAYQIRQPLQVWAPLPRRT